MQFQTFDRFYSKADELRRVFDTRFADPLRSTPERFVWDYWNVAEYTLLRTPAYTYFPSKIYERFHRYLVNWGRENLGCHDISPPWLSCYIEGCKQDPHQDVPHGPLAFVYSLTPSKRVFKGGETFLKKPRTLIEPNYNRLIVFNPAITHGVRRVRGTHDPRQGRLVIHGWFVNPRPFWVGPLQVDDVREAVEHGLATDTLPSGQGLLSLRLQITKAGRVRGTRVLVNTLSSAKGLTGFLDKIQELKFPARKGSSQLTLPLMFGE